MEENRGQEVVPRRKLEELKWCECSEKKKGKAVCSSEGKAQQSSAWARALESAAKEGSSQREVR